MNEATEVTGIFSEEPIFYVYTHKRNDSNKVFYVGKGKERRAWSTKSRNPHWKHIVDKHGYTVEILQENMDECSAFDLEKETINFYGIDTLTNMTLGGHSSTGYKHTDETRKLQSEIALQRRKTNPEWFQNCLNRMSALNESQRADPDFYKRIGRLNSENYAKLSEEGKREFAEKRTAWLKDGEKRKAALKKQAAVRATPEVSAKVSAALKKAWANKPEEAKMARAELSRKQMNDPEFKAMILELKSKKIVVNKRILFNCMKDFSRLLGHEGSLYSSMKTNLDKGYSFTVYKGCVVEDYNPEIHKDLVTYSEGIEMKQISNKVLPASKALVMDNGRVFLSILEAANYFGDKVTDSTADWISRCMKNGKPAMGHYWRVASMQEIEIEVLKRLDDLYRVSNIKETNE